MTNPLVEKLIKDFALEHNGFHGKPHWDQVLVNAEEIADKMAARDKYVNTKILFAFAMIHDSQRFDEDEDIYHGTRAANWIGAHRTAVQDYFELDRVETNTLRFAVALHSDGLITADEHGLYKNTIEACWDADRLDLPRVGVEVDPARLCTDEAREILSERNAIA